jgi:hypothetical protein
MRLRCLQFCYLRGLADSDPDPDPDPDFWF